MVVSSIEPWVLSFDPQWLLLRQRWNGHYSRSTFRADVERVVQQLQEWRVRRWLVDLNGMPHLSLEDQMWFATVVVPVLATLPIKSLAVVFSSSFHNQRAVESMAETEARYIRCDMQFFADVQAADEWLVNPDAPKLFVPEPKWRMSA
ncbi:hypothetical protein [Hymenobacter koreensis]|uniref:STAS/SEC14 domain-containing protein n=1 Tax=Hymenobacter koreensis TaxID=1084523 RepID=A0ABP8IXE4_9BACT